MTLKIGNNEYELTPVTYERFQYEGDKLPDFNLYFKDDVKKNLFIYSSVKIDNRYYGVKLINK